MELIRGDKMESYRTENYPMRLVNSILLTLEENEITEGEKALYHKFVVELEEYMEDNHIFVIKVDGSIAVRNDLRGDLYLIGNHHFPNLIVIENNYVEEEYKIKITPTFEKGYLTKLELPYYDLYLDENVPLKEEYLDPEH